MGKLAPQLKVLLETEASQDAEERLRQAFAMLFAGTEIVLPDESQPADLTETASRVS